MVYIYIYLCNIYIDIIGVFGIFDIISVFDTIGLSDIFSCSDKGVGNKNNEDTKEGV